VFITFMVEPAGRAVAMPWRAGMVVNVMFPVFADLII
jgi:hypothetical protein